MLQSFQGDNLGDGTSSRIYETVRSEVRRAIADIQNDLESVSSCGSWMIKVFLHDLSCAVSMQDVPLKKKNSFDVYYNALLVMNAWHKFSQLVLARTCFKRP